MIRQVPELADGGYWYVVPAVTQDNARWPDYAGAHYCAQYGTVGGTIYAALRMLERVDIPEQPVSVSEVIAAAVVEGSLPANAKFFARLGGV